MKIIKVVSLTTLCGIIAKYATQQSPYHCPDNLTEAIRLFYASAEKKAVKEPSIPDWPLIEVSKIKELLETEFFTLPFVRAWNERKSDNPASFVLITRYFKPSPDDDFIDLNALRMNVEQEVIRGSTEIPAFNFNL